MKKSRFTDSQIMAILKQHENGVSVADLAREHGCSTAVSFPSSAQFDTRISCLYSPLKF